jgi:hypothetical protein
MTQPPDDWRRLFGAIDVSAEGVQPAPVSPSQAPSPTSSSSLPTSGATPGTPSLGQRAVSFGNSMAKFAAGGFQTTAASLQEQRLAICGGCPQYQSTMCLACGCVVPLKVKMPHETCPLGRWPA